MVVSSISAGISVPAGTVINSITGNTAVLSNVVTGSTGSASFEAVGPSDTAANGGGLILKGTVDKSILYDNSRADKYWVFTENLEIAPGKKFVIGNQLVLNTTTLGSTVVTSSLTTVGTLSGLTVSGNATFDTNTLFVDAANDRVGIGTTNPGAKLHVSGGEIKSGSVLAMESRDIGLSPGIRELFRVDGLSLCTGGIFALSGTRNGFVHTSMWSWSSTHNSTGRGMLTQLSSGEYANITVYLDITGNGDVIICADVGGTTTLQISVTKYAGSNIDFSSANADRTSAAANYVRHYTQTTASKSFITNTGVFQQNVGIGTTNPGAKLHLSVADASSDGTKGIRITNPAGTIAMLECGANNDSYVGTESSSNFSIRTQNSPRITILGGGGAALGNVGIGTTNPGDKLDVRGTISAAGRALNVPHIVVKNSSGYITYFEYYFSALKNTGIGTATQMNILSVGNLTGFHQAAFTVEYGTRIQGVSDATTSVCLKQFGVNRFNSGNVAITDTNDIASDTNSNTYANVTCVTNGANAYIIRVEFSSSVNTSSFVSGVLRGWGVSDSFDAGSNATLTFSNGPT